MDILHLVDRLEELFNESRPIPLTHSVILDEDRILEIIDQMRISIPEEVKKAQQVLAQRDRVMAQAQEEATRTLSLAKRQTEETISKDSMVQAAQTRAEQILEQARAQVEVMRRDADEYVIESLTALEEELTRPLGPARAGRGPAPPARAGPQRHCQAQRRSPGNAAERPGFGGRRGSLAQRTLSAPCSCRFSAFTPSPATEAAPRPARSTAASSKPRKSGWGLFGRETSSGWNWLPTMKGWPANSAISTRRPSGESPE